MLRIVLALFLFFLLPYQAHADLESAMAAYEAGDYETAVKELLPLAEAGDAQAQQNLGSMYTEGKGVPKDYAEAIKWFRKAAAQGNALGQSNLGFMYYKGFGVQQDYTEALMWYRKSAEQGNAGGQFNLGVMYHRGYGLQKNNVQAYAWTGIAAANGNADAVQVRNYLETQLTPNELEEAYQLARELWDKYGNKENN